MKTKLKQKPVKPTVVLPQPAPPASVQTGLDEKTLQLIMSADLANIVKKVKAGKPLSKQERQLVNQAKKPSEPLANLAIKELRSTAAGKGSWRKVFIKTLSDVPNVTHACEVARITDTTAYDTRKSSKAFAVQWEKALTKGVERLEKAAYDRARDGVTRNVWMKDENGKPIKVDEVKDFSDGLAIFLLKAHLPAKYREPLQGVNASVTTADGTVATFSVGVTEAELPE